MSSKSKQCKSANLLPSSFVRLTTARCWLGIQIQGVTLSLSSNMDLAMAQRLPMTSHDTLVAKGKKHLDPAWGLLSRSSRGFQSISNKSPSPTSRGLHSSRSTIPRWPDPKLWINRFLFESLVIFLTCHCIVY